MIKSFSKLRATILAANKMVALNSATAIKYRFVDGIQQIEANYSTSDVTLDIDNADTLSTSVTAFDSRGLTSAVTVAMSLMANYVSLSLYGMTLTRDNGVDAPVKLNINGVLWNKYFSSDSTSNTGGGVLNTVTTHYRFKNTTNDWSTQNGTVTMTIANPCVVTKTAHGFNTGDAIYFTTTGALPTGLSINTIYYVIVTGANTFNLATSYANALASTTITTTGSQSGVHTINVGCPWTSFTPSVDGSGNITFNNYINGDLGASGFTTSKSFDIQVRGYDALTNTIVTQTLSVGIPLIDYTKYGIAIKQKYDTTDTAILQLNGSVSMEELSATPSNPTQDVQAKVYIKSNKFIIQWNDAGTVRYKYLDLTSTGVTWVHSTSAP